MKLPNSADSSHNHTEAEAAGHGSASSRVSLCYCELHDNRPKTAETSAFRVS
jgi:hypothetical protein